MKQKLTRRAEKHLIRLREIMSYKEECGRNAEEEKKRNNLLHDVSSLRWALYELGQIYDCSDIQKRRLNDPKN